jgi:hypothetical protein
MPMVSLRVLARRLIAAVTDAQYMYDAAYQPDLAKVKANRGIAISRYFVGDNSSWQWKRVTPDQVSDARSAGLGMVCNMEGSADPLAAARAIGMSYQNYGQNLARWGLVDLQKCAVPAGAGIAMYFSIDVNTPPDQYPNVRELFDGINDVLPSAGYLTKVYSQGGLIDYLCAWHRVQGKQWLAAPTSWPGYKTALAGPNVAMVQLVGTPVPETDQNKVLDPNAVAAYWPASSPYATEEDVALDPNDPIVQEIRADLDKLKANTVLDIAHPGTPSLGDVWRLANADTTDTTHGWTNAAIARDLAAFRSAVAGSLTDVTTAINNLQAAIDALPTVPATAPTAFDMSGTLTPKATP